MTGPQVKYMYTKGLKIPLLLIWNFKVTVSDGFLDFWHDTQVVYSGQSVFIVMGMTRVQL